MKRCTDRVWKLALAALLLTPALAACSNGNSGNKPAGNEGQPPAQENKQEPAELSVYYMGSDGSVESFMDTYGKQIQKKHPNVTLKWMNYNTVKFEDLAPTQTNVDVFYGPTGPYSSVVNAGYAELDISDLLKTYKFDVNTIEPASLQLFKSMNGGKLNALPVHILYLIMAYNRDIFDKFGEPYVKDGLTWEQAYEVAKKLTRQEAGVQYIGFGNQQTAAFWRSNQYGQPLFDTEKGIATLEGGKWVDIFQRIAPFYQLPGTQWVADPMNLFVKEKRLAMMVGLNSQAIGATFVDVNYDVAQLPTFGDRPGVGSGPNPMWFSVSSTTKHKEASMQAVLALLDMEYQKERAKAGAYPALKIDGLESILLSDSPKMKDRNVKGLIPRQFAQGPVPTLYGVAPTAAMNKALEQVIKGEKDINSALREANETVNKQLQEKKAAGAK